MLSLGGQEGDDRSHLPRIGRIVSLQRVGGTEIVVVALSPAAVLVLDRVARDAYRAGRYTGLARAALVDAVTAVNSAAAEIMCARRGTSDAVSGDGDAAAVASLRPSVVPARPLSVSCSGGRCADRAMTVS